MVSTAAKVLSYKRLPQNILADVRERIDGADKETLESIGATLRYLTDEGTYQYPDVLASLLTYARATYSTKFGAKAAPKPEAPKPAAKPERCSRCGGDGIYKWGAVINGVPQYSGVCFRCNGSGKEPERVSYRRPSAEANGATLMIGKEFSIVYRAGVWFKAQPETLAENPNPERYWEVVYGDTVIDSGIGDSRGQRLEAEERAKMRQRHLNRALSKALDDFERGKPVEIRRCHCGVILDAEEGIASEECRRCRDSRDGGPDDSYIIEDGPMAGWDQLNQTWS